MSHVAIFYACRFAIQPPSIHWHCHRRGAAAAIVASVCLVIAAAAALCASRQQQEVIETLD